MKNRTLTSPIRNILVLSLVAGTLVAKADFTVPRATESTPVPVPAPETQYVSTPATTPAVASASSSVAPVSKHTTSYTVVAGDSLTKIAQKFNTTRKKLRELNNLTASVVTVKPGQVLLVPSLKSSKTSAIATSAAKEKAHHAYLVAQPVQDFDIPASTFASCPVPIPSEDDAIAAPSPVVAEKPAPVAKPIVTAPQVTNTEIAPDNSARYFTSTVPANSAAIGSSGSRTPTPVFNSPSLRLNSRGLNPGFGAQPQVTTEANDWGNRFLQEARLLGDQGIEYDEDWRPPGESHAWTMDCSNTARYLYKVTTGIQLPRTASDQYYYLHLQGKAWDVPQTAEGWADTNFLRHNLKPGDLLFWENTYRPERQPPITHVMVFLGANESGQWIMAGSQTSRGGEHNRRNGGPDIYVFRPSQACGGYTTWLGLVHHQGRFCAFGRPLEADRSKLAVAEND